MCVCVCVCVCVFVCFYRKEQYLMIYKKQFYRYKLPIFFPFLIRY